MPVESGVCDSLLEGIAVFTKGLAKTSVFAQPFQRFMPTAQKNSYSLFFF
jgi:hypothetical protein